MADGLPQTDKAPKQVELESRLETLNDEIEQVRGLSCDIEGALNRLGAPHTDEIAKDGREPEEPQTYVQRLDYALDRLRAVRHDLAESSSRLKGVI